MKHICLNCGMEVLMEQAMTHDGSIANKTICPMCGSVGSVVNVLEEKDEAVEALRTMKRICDKYSSECFLYDFDKHGKDCPLFTHCDARMGIGYPCDLKIK